MRLRVLPVLGFVGVRLLSGQLTVGDAEFAGKADRLLQQSVEALDFPGVVALVGTREEVVYRGAAGHARLAPKARITPDTVFRLASLTKPVTAAAVLTLVADGKLNLDEPIANHLPEFAAPHRLERDWLVALTSWRTRRRLHTRLWSYIDPYKTVPASEKITVRHLLSQQSGIASVWDEPTVFQVNRVVREHNPEQTLASVSAGLARLPLHFEPGSEWRYGEGYEVAARLVEAVSQTPFAGYVRSRILAPLGMDDTTFFLTAQQIDRLAVAYVLKSSGTAFDELDGFWGRDWARKPGDYASGGWGLNGTAADYGRFCRAPLRGGELDGVRVLPERLVQEMTRNQIGGHIDIDWPGFEHFSYGLGVWVREQEADPPLNSAGSWGWFGHIGTYFWVDPERGVFGVVLTQSSNPPFDLAAALQRLIRKSDTR